jgi:hypothetical protein
MIRFLLDSQAAGWVIGSIIVWHLLYIGDNFQ